jgi:hypothetical protein
MPGLDDFDRYVAEHGIPPGCRWITIAKTAAALTGLDRAAVDALARDGLVRVDGERVSPA